MQIFFTSLSSTILHFAIQILSDLENTLHESQIICNIPIHTFSFLTWWQVDDMMSCKWYHIYIWYYNIASTSIQGTDSVAVNIPVIYISGKLESDTNTLALFICPQPEPGYRNGEQRLLSFSTRENILFKTICFPLRYQISDETESYISKSHVWNGV